MTDADTKGENASKKMDVCRGCMGKVGLTGQNFSHELRRMFTACTGLEVTEFDGLPLCVCSSCENKIFYCYEFVSCCKKTDVNLREVLTDCSPTWNFQIVKTESIDHDISDDDVKPHNVDSKQSFFGHDISDDDVKPNNVDSKESFHDHDISDDDVKPHNVDSEESFPDISYDEMKIDTVVDNLDTDKKIIEKENTEKKLENKKIKKSDVKNETKIKKASIVCSSTNGKFVCSHCPKEFARKVHLKKHISIHNHGEPFTCNICNKKYKQRSHLNRHQKIHTGEKPFKCDICDMSFVLKSSLLVHSKQHDGTSHICHLCGSEFTQLGNLNVHMRVHTGEKPYACSKCTYRCSVQASLRKHERVHSNIRPYSCTVCNKSFNCKSSHSRHNRIHTGELPYKCSYCSKAFIDNWKRKIHLMKAHNIAMMDTPHLSGGRKRIYTKNTSRKDETEIS